MRDLAAGTTSHVSLRDGAMIGGRLGSPTPSLNLDGSCVAFRSTSDDLSPAATGPTISTCSCTPSPRRARR